MLSRLKKVLYGVWKFSVGLLAVQASMAAGNNRQAKVLADTTSTVSSGAEMDAFAVTTSSIISQLGTNAADPVQLQNDMQCSQAKPAKPDRLSELIKRINIKQSNKNPSKSRALIEADEKYKKRISDVLYKVANENALQLLIDGNVEIHVYSEADMFEVSKMRGFDAQTVKFVANGKPGIVIELNEHLFANPSRFAEEQLIFLLANELSHATIGTWKIKKSMPENSSWGAPWQNDLEKDNFLKAYETFVDNISEYQALVKKYNSAKGQKKMSQREKTKLKRYDEAMMTYVAPRMSKDCYNHMQACDVKRGEKVVTVRDSNADVVPDHSQQKKRLEYFREDLFRFIESAKLSREYALRNKIGFYAEYNADKEFADRLSDFESLSPTMRMKFGPELCELLDQFLDIKDHCDRPNWPAPGAIL